MEISTREEVLWTVTLSEEIGGRWRPD